MKNEIPKYIKFIYVKILKDKCQMRSIVENGNYPKCIEDCLTCNVDYFLRKYLI